MTSGPTPVDEPTAGIEPTGSDTSATSPGGSLGRYVIISELGQGAMGLVLRAYDPRLEREVALKLLRTKPMGEAAEQRLIREARAMAQLSHPHVVAVYDVEFVGGQVVVAMEYVRGTTLSGWLREQERSWSEIVQAFVAAGWGLAAAHRADILHRDFKPSNVLVADRAEADPTRGPDVKVTDFGLARMMQAATTSDHETASRTTTPGSSASGTPRYMAPEQHLAEELSPATDQYALCVSLWEALVGHPPFDRRSRVQDKLAGPPPWPDVAVPAYVVAALERGLAPRPGDRWADVEALLRALQPDPRRRRAWWITGGAVGLGLAAAAGARLSTPPPPPSEPPPCQGAAEQLHGAWNPQLAEQVATAVLATEAPHAPEVWERTKPRLDDYAAAWVQMHTDACEATAVRKEQSSAVLDLRMACLGRARDELSAVTRVLTDATTRSVTRAHRVVSGLPALERCANIEGLLAEVDPPLPEDLAAIDDARAALAQAKMRRLAGDLGGAEEALARADDALALAEYPPAHTERQLAQALLHEARGQWSDAEATYLQVLEQAAGLEQWSLLRTANQRLVYVLGFRQKRMAEATPLLSIGRGLARGSGPHEIALTNSIAVIRFSEGKFAEAEAEARKALALVEQEYGLDDVRSAAARTTLAGALHKQQKLQEAEAELRTIVELRRRAQGDTHPDVAGARGNLALTLRAQGKHQEAEAEHRAALAIEQSLLGPDHPSVAKTTNNLAMSLWAQERYAEAEPLLRKALAMRLAQHDDPQHVDIASVRENLSIVLRSLGRDEEAEAEQRQALEAKIATLGEKHPRVAGAHGNLGVILRALGRLAEAEAEQRRALAIYEALDPDHPHAAGPLTNLAVLLVKRGALEEAERLAERALELGEATLGEDHADTKASRQALEDARAGLGRR